MLGGSSDPPHSLFSEMREQWERLGRTVWAQVPIEIQTVKRVDAACEQGFAQGMRARADHKPLSAAENRPHTVPNRAAGAGEEADDDRQDSRPNGLDSLTLAEIVRTLAAERFGPAASSHAGTGRRSTRHRKKTEAVFIRKVAALDGVHSSTKVSGPAGTPPALT